MKILITGWYKRAKAAAAEGIPNNERISSAGIFVFCLLLIIYFVMHQYRNSGFFTNKFGTLEMLLFYGFWSFWLITAGLEGISGKRFYSRVFDVFGGILIAFISTIWLFTIFPFEYTYFADLLPESLQFILTWITNDVARIIMGLSVLLHFGALIYSPIAYKFVVFGNKSQ